MHEYSSLANFWKRYNKVLLDRLGLEREKQTLEDENKKLKALLKQYLDGMQTNKNFAQNNMEHFIDYCFLFCQAFQ